MRKITILFLALFLVLAVVSCSPATQPVNSQPEPQATSPASPDTSATDYPSSVDLNPVIIDYPAPGYPAPGGAPVLEARANGKVELVEQLEDPQFPAYVILKGKLVSATPVEGTPDRFTPLIGQEVSLYANKEGLPTLTPGDTFTAEIIFRGDEANQVYFAENIQK